MSRVSLEEAVARLAAGEVVALPTETVYGLAADALDPRALARIYATKGRPADHPLILHGVAPGRPGPGALGYGGPDPRADELARRFWPGPLTLVLLRTAVVPLVLTGGHDTVAVRAPAHPLFEEVLRRLGRPLAAPSANPFGRVSPTTAGHVLADWPELPVLDGGECRVGVESTILDLSGDNPALLRPGGVPVEAIEAVIGPVVRGGDTAAPGTLPSHYAPRAEVLVVDDVSTHVSRLRAAGRRVGVIEAEPAERYAAHLYQRLRALDAEGVEVIVAAAIPEVGLGVAVMDRLRRAAAARPTEG